MTARIATHVVTLWYIRQGFGAAESREFAREDVAALQREVDSAYPTLSPVGRAAQVARLAKERHAR